MSSDTLNLMISKDLRYTSSLSKSMSSMLRFNVDKHNMLVVIKEIDDSTHAAVLDECDEYKKINVLLTPKFNRSAIILLNNLRSKISCLMVVTCAEWEDLRPLLSFCPQTFFILQDDMVDAQKFARYM